MERTTQQHQTDRPERPHASPEHPPIWENTRPRENAQLDREDLNRGVDRLEAVLGR